MIGSRIGGRYDILRAIGDGGMSRVYLAHDAILNRDVAIKVLHYDFANEEELKRRFQREALSATSLTHPYIVDIFDVGEDGELHYLVMEYVEGQTLKQFIQSEGPLTPERALPIMQQLVSAISNAHHNGIVHRDIKPQNILMDADGNVKITDFGIAMALSATAHTKTNSVIGTVHYLSPEQARGGMATKKSDIYSLGIVFYELLTGELPFSAETAVAIALKHLQEETPSVRAAFPSIPQSVENVILKATAKDASYRYRSADEMYDDLLTVLSPERADEEKFSIPYDDDKTMAIPVVKDVPKFEEAESTKKIEPVVIEPPQAPKKKRKKWPIVAGIVGGVIVVALLAILIISLLGPKQAIVPDVSGMDEAEAISMLEEEGFKVDEPIEQTSDEIEAGKVIQTIPEANKKREVGSSIKLYISTGKEKFELLDYTGRSYETVESTLNVYGFRSIKADTQFSDEPEGTIIGQDPTGGTEVVPGETDLVFTVSKGKETRTLGNLIGYNENQLTDYAESTGFNISVVGHEHSDTVPAGQVISQVPDKGTAVEKGGRVQVIVSKGPEKKTVQLIVHRVTIPYEPDVSEPVDEEQDEEGNWQQPEPVPQQIKIYIQDRTRNLNDVYDEFTITESTSRQLKFELEEGQQGAYKITRDDQVFIEESVDYSDSN